MATNLDIDNKLIQEATELSGLKTKKQAVTLALKEFIQRHKQAGIIKLFGKIDFDPTYDYKKHRDR